MKVSRKRLSKANRRNEILRAAVPVFARYGFRGATTRMLAEAAGVSEALLYRHFSSKEALYEEIGRQHLQDGSPLPQFVPILAMPAGTRRLIASVQVLLAHVYDADRSDVYPRLLAQSLLEDGQLAQTVLGKFHREFTASLSDSIRTGLEAGDFVTDADPGNAEVWVLGQLAFAIGLHQLPEKPVLDRPSRDRDFLDRAIRFALRGIGLRPSAINQHYDPSFWNQLCREH